MEKYLPILSIQTTNGEDLVSVGSIQMGVQNFQKDHPKVPGFAFSSPETTLKKLGLKPPKITKKGTKTLPFHIF